MGFFASFFFYGFLPWLIGLPIFLMLDAYIKGRFNRTLFAQYGDEWDEWGSKFFWPIYFACMSIYYFFKGLGKTLEFICTHTYDFSIKVLKNIENKGKQANDIDYQAEKYLLRDD